MALSRLHSSYLIFLGCIILMGCAESTGPQKQILQGEALGTGYQIIYFSNETEGVPEAMDSVFREINQSMSTYIPNSDISRINSGDTTVVVDHMFREVFAISREVYKHTNGAFDPTVGILTDAWGFGPGKAMTMDSTKVDSLLNYVGFNKIRLTEENKIEKDYTSIRLDFNAVAKGYAIDRLAMVLEQKDFENYLIEVGGELRGGGKNLEKDAAWAVGIDDPLAEENREIITVISLSDRALASSGNYRKFRIDSLTGAKYVHTIDPKTGFTRNSNILAASILASTCAEADAYATAVMAMPLEASIELLQGAPGLDGFIIYSDEKGEMAFYETPGFAGSRLR